MISEDQSVISKQTEDFFTALNLKVKKLKASISSKMCQTRRQLYFLAHANKGN